MIIEVRDDTLALSGNLKKNEWNTLADAVRILLRRHPEGLVLDCSELRVLTPAGAETFREAEAKLSCLGARLVVAGLHSDAMRTLRTVPNLSSHLPVAETVAAARTSLGLVPRQKAEDTPTYAVVLLGSAADAHAVGALAQLTPKGETVLVLFPLQVPRDHSLLSSLGHDEEEARAQMELYTNALHACGLRTVERVERTRNRAQRILTVLDEIPVRQLVLALPTNADEELYQTAKELTKAAPCPTLMIRVASGGVS